MIEDFFCQKLKTAPPITINVLFLYAQIQVRPVLNSIYGNTNELSV